MKDKSQKKTAGPGVQKAGIRHFEGDDGLYMERIGRDGPVRTRLTNFRAKVLRSIVTDDGAQKSTTLLIEAWLDGKPKKKFEMTVSDFMRMDWAANHIGLDAIVYPNAAQHARVAIQQMARDVKSCTRFAHVGWRRHRGKKVFLHAGGAIGASGKVTDIKVDLGDLHDFYLPSPPTGDDLIAAIKASLAVLEVGPLSLTCPVLGAVFRALLGGTDFTIWLDGLTGGFKSEMAALAQQHFGKNWSRLNLPGTWLSTDNATEYDASRAKDVVFVIDDYKPGVTAYEAALVHAKAERLIQGQGNLAGRKRLNRATYRPGGLLISTGEDVPRGTSLRARMLIIHMKPGDIDSKRLTECQRDGAAGLFAKTMAGFVQWLAPDLDEKRSYMREKVAALRENAAVEGMHRRTPEVIANLQFGMRLFLDFAANAGAITSDERDELRGISWKALKEVAATQPAEQLDADDAQLFLFLVRQTLATGKAYVANKSGKPPQNAKAWGWGPANGGVRKPKGVLIGRKLDSDLYLDPQAAFTVAKIMGKKLGRNLSVEFGTLKRRLSDRGLLVTTELNTKRQVFTVRKKFRGMTRSMDFLHLEAASVI